MLLLHCSKTLKKYQFNDKWLLFLGIPALGLMLAILPFIFIKNNSADNNFWFRIMVSLLFSTICWIGCRQIVFTLWRVFPWDKRPILHLCFEVPAIFAYVSFLNLVIIWWIFVFVIHKEFVMTTQIWQNIFISNLVAFFVTALHEGVFFYLQWRHNIKRSEDLEKSTYEAQYENLRSQVNPHFLFNSLNTLAAQVEDNPGAVSFVENLSDFLRYSLSNTGRELVPLCEELNMIGKYKYLQQTRFGQNLEIEMDVPEENQHMYVAPLALQMLVENAIKHNIISKDKPLKIKIFMSNNNYLSVENNLQKKIEPGRSTGIGLKNIINRYQYLTIKKVIVIESSTKYKVSVPLVEFESAREKQ
ncbi:MAG: histidine kinase [Bacteroidetes bacterium]|nr:histidine kinase [Bacteroidota bacterium]